VLRITLTAAVFGVDHTWVKASACGKSWVKAATDRYAENNHAVAIV